MNARKSNVYSYRFAGTTSERRAADLFLAELRGQQRSVRADDDGVPAPALTSSEASDARRFARAEVLDAERLDEADEGERAVHIPQIVAHAASGTRYDLRGNNCIVRWANVPQGYAGEVDVVVHFHGFQGHDAMRLQHKADASGVDLDAAGLTRPSVGLIPHGHAFPARHRCGPSVYVSCPRDTWRTTCPSSGREVTCQDGFDFPALRTRADLLRFVQTALAEVARERGSSGLSRARMIVTGHSGGGAHLSQLCQAFRDADEIHAFHFFDATYGGQEPIIARGGWLERALRRDAAALTGTNEDEWRWHMQRGGCNLRLAFIADTGTASAAIEIDRFIARTLRELVPDDARRRFLRRYYRAQSTNQLSHGAVPRALGGPLLVDGSSDLSAVLRDLPALQMAPRASRRARAPEIRRESISDSEFASEASAALPESAESVSTAALTQSDVDRLASVSISGARDIDAFFARGGGAGFAAWFNAELAGRGPFVRREHALRMPVSREGRARFDRFWDQIEVVYARPQITLLDFAALMCLILNETGGRFEALPEDCSGHTDREGRAHRGLAYAFDRIPGFKTSYNTPSNRTAGSLFNDAEFIRAHAALPGGTALAGRGDMLERAWHGELYPQPAFDSSEDPAVNGFIMQADFYKFRGRGVIQTTKRGAYLPVIAYVRDNPRANPGLREFSERWRGLTDDVVATTSTTHDWDRIFDVPEVLARAVRLHVRRDERHDYLSMSRSADVLQAVPAPDQPRREGSIYGLGRCVSGRRRYVAGIYRDRVLALLHAAKQLA